MMGGGVVLSFYYFYVGGYMRVNMCGMECVDSMFISFGALAEFEHYEFMTLYQ